MALSVFDDKSKEPTMPELYEILGETAMQDGAAAAMAQYKELEREYHGAGVYDFREGIFGELAEEAIEAGKPEVAVQMLRSSLEMFPESADLHAFLGMAQVQSGDARGAAVSLAKALELEPDNRYAQRGMKMLERARP